MKQNQMMFNYYSLTVFQLPWAKMAEVDHDPRLPCRVGGLTPPSSHEVLSSTPSTAKKKPRLPFLKACSILLWFH
jgi:hypothetical protein